VRVLTLMENWLTAFPRPTLLIVDDQSVHIHALNELFHEECDVLVAKSGAQAIRICQSQLPDLVLLDVMMDGMDGYEVCRQFKADPITRHIPVIFLTSNDDEMDEIFGFAIGAVDYIIKPIKPVIVRARVKTQLALKQQNDLLRTIALIDGLTGVANRRKFDNDLEIQWRHCQREQLPLSLIMLDVDYFKHYNDHYGHLAGDTCLRAVANALMQSLNRPNDLAARYGGEEFAVILPNTDAAGALHIATQIIVAVRELGIEHVTSDAAPTVTVSAGIATLVPVAGLTKDDLIIAADKHLYSAKHAGRNQVASA